MSRTTRTLLVLGLMAVSAVVALGWMADRYSKVLEGRQGRTARADALLPEAEADLLVRGYLDVLLAVRTAGENVAALSTAAREDELRRSFERALADRGLDRATYQELDGVARAWSRGSDEVPPAYREALDRHADEAMRLLEEAYDPLDP